MVLALAPPAPPPAPPAHILTLDAPVGSEVVIRLDERERPGRLARLATPGALIYGSVFPLVQLGLALEYPGGGPSEGRWAIAATACYMPLHLYHVYWAARGERPPAGRWTLLAMFAVIAAATPVAGSNWLPAYADVAFGAVVVLRWPWALLAVTALAAGQAPLALALDSPVPAAASYYVFVLLRRASALFLPIWLVGAIRQLDGARRSLADDAVVAERIRIDGELRTTVGTALSSIAAGGTRVTTLIDGDAGSQTVAREVRELADGSRRALADARHLLSGFQRPSLAAELETAARLLTAAGVETRVEVPPEGVPSSATDPPVRAALRTATARVLHDDRARACVIRVSRRDGSVDVDVATEATAGADRGAGHGADHEVAPP
jgi:two-component system, NarL family, sensor histidine kinase DesK